MRTANAPSEDAAKMIVVVMGVSGVGKSTVGKRLADGLHWEFADADNYHPPANVAKMSRGIPLDDSDRAPWLLSLELAVEQWLAEERDVILACSALKAAFRARLCSHAPGRIQFIYLKADYLAIAERLANRRNHFMKKELLKSQFDSLEEPEVAIQVDATQSLEAIVDEIASSLKGQ
jgi:gluconokinase